MKKILLPILIAFVAIVGYAQNNEEIAQPSQVVGRRINSDGQVTKEFISNFHYLDDGKLSDYSFPEYAVNTYYTYEDDFLMQEQTWHQGGHPIFTVTTDYTYENGNVKSITHLVSQMGLNVYLRFEYYEDGRLKQKERMEEGDDDYHEHWIYEYEDGDNMVIESYWTSWVSQGMRLRKKTTNQYDDSFNLTLVYTENYNESGALTLSLQDFYTYSLTGKLEKVVRQTLSEGEWQNTSITQYAYDGEDHLAEQLDGIWNPESGAWDFNTKITFETSEDELTYTVSFYKKNGDEWVWDVFNNQTILFGSDLKLQQQALAFMVYESMNGMGKVNQIEFTLIITKTPTYLDVEEQHQQNLKVYPNPTQTELHLQYSPDVQPTQIELYDLQGRMVRTQNKGLESINVEGLPAGTYTMRVVLENGKVYSDKVVKE